MTAAEIRLNFVALSLLEDVEDPISGRQPQRVRELNALRKQVAQTPTYLEVVLAEVSDTAIRDRLRAALTESQ